MPNTFHEKAIRQPFRVGLMLGALILPTLWVISQDISRVINGQPLLDTESITGLFASGFLQGMILGAGAVRAWVAWHKSESGKARRLLIGHSLVVAIPASFLLAMSLKSVLALLMPGNQHQILRAVAELIYFQVPLQVALAMLLLGLFMRGNRA